jgi:hypothetical protein
MFMPSIREKNSVDRARVSNRAGAGEPPGEPGVLGTGVEIGGVSPVLEP